MKFDFPKLPIPVGMIVKEHEIPGQLVANGGRIISKPSLFDVQDVRCTANEFLFTTTQIQDFALMAVLKERKRLGIVECSDPYYVSQMPPLP